MLTTQLRRVLLVLVLLNLVFVQITGAVSARWMLPLFALTVASPFLWNLQRLLAYRLGWNVALITIFGLLVVDVRQTGIRFMLEDGLILAAFCQVHVLNNLIKQKRPDLIFFNSFLIALVTGFFCQDVVYSMVFVIYAFVLVIGMALTSSSTVGNLPARALNSRKYRGLVRRSTRHGVVVLFFTGLVFTFFPRDFDREGLVDEELVESTAASEVGFSDQIRLDRKNNTKISRRVVITAKLTQGTPRDVPMYWRGATFTQLTRHGWIADTNRQGRVNGSRQLDEPWRRTADGYFRPDHHTAAKLTVRLNDRHAQHLFLPTPTNRIQFTCPAYPNVDGNFRLSWNQGGQILYRLHLNEAGTRLKKMRREPGADHLNLHPRRIPEGSHDWNEQARRRIPAGADRLDKVEALRAFVANAREYVLPGEPGAADDLVGFLAGRGGGHCEYFATTLMVLLRLNMVPCRLVSGYFAHEWNDEGTLLTIRSNHAHAWVEVWDENMGWYIVDPTPPQDAATGDDASMVATVQEWFRNAWVAVTSFDGKSRAAALAWARDRLFALAVLIQQNPFAVAMLAFGLFFLRWLLRARRRRRIDPDIRAYLGVLARLKLELQPGETPRQLLVRADLPEQSLGQLTEATHRHERARYQ